MYCLMLIIRITKNKLFLNCHFGENKIPLLAEIHKHLAHQSIQTH